MPRIDLSVIINFKVINNESNEYELCLNTGIDCHIFVKRVLVIF